HLQKTDNEFLKGKNILITGGPTREYLDSVRFISNPSTGKMGIALANSAKNHGANVKLILGPTPLSAQKNIETEYIISSDEMYKAVVKNFQWADVVIMSAAVEDIKPKSTNSKKIKKNQIPNSLQLVKTKDILLELGKQKRDQILIGFSVETENEVQNSIEKLKRKNLDFIVVNNPNVKGAGFGSDTNKTTIITKDEEIIENELMRKVELADKIIQRVSKSFTQSSQRKKRTQRGN
ncbi:MAG: phosphopantothenoylcysteine decarboxylase, partial [Candidatus Marinimicrobia bacterium]|nr:phosphopantothenoylcysteine decarboxylase [Candidatus Neomarinimicrobiota bacterium]